MAISSALKKTTLLLLLTTLTIGYGASVSWNSPSDGDELQDPISMNVTMDADGQVNFTVEGPNSEEYSNSGNTDGDYITQEFSAGSGNGGDYTLNAEDQSSLESIDVTIDESGPSIELDEERDYITSDQDLTFDINDDVTGVEDVDITASDSDVIDTTEDCDGDQDCKVDVSLDTDSPDEGDNVDITVDASDSVDNENSESFSFTLDTEWEGDSSADVEWDESDSNVLDGFTGEDQDVLISFEPDSVSETSISCEVDGDEVSSDSVEASDDEETLDCSFDHDEYEGSSFDLTVEAEDKAGNPQTLVDEKEMVWDTQAPTVTDLSQSNGISTFNSGFNLDLLASDDAFGIQNVEYYFDANTDVGNGNQVSLDSPGSTALDREVSIDPSGLGQGTHTAYVRVEDGTGKTDIETFDFEYFPDRDPEVNFNAPETVEVTSGETETFSLTIENGAPFYLNGVEVESDSAIWNGTVTATGLEEDNSVEKTVNVDASNVDVGTYDLVLETVDIDDSVTVEVVVRATEEQKSQIESDLQEWSNLSTELEENISSIGTLEESNDNVSSFLKKISNVQAAVEEGRYYEAKNILDGVDSDFANAQKTYSNALDEHRSNRRTQLLMLLVVGVLVLGGGGIAAFFLLREEEMLEDMDIDVPELGVIEKLKDLINQAEDEVEEETGYRFDGFD